jgi:hypothetical protein
MSRRRNQLIPRQRYPNLHRGLTELLYRHDPVGLAAAGAPRDEYEPEVGTIIPRLKHANTLDDVRRIVHREFLRWFDAEEATGPESSHNAIAQEIWEKFVKRGVVGE